MSFLRHGEIYHFDEGAIPADHALAHRNDEFPAGYSWAGCAPAEPAAASPAGAHLARKDFRGTMQFQRTVRSALTACLTPGDNPKEGSQVYALVSPIRLSPSHIFFLSYVLIPSIPLWKGYCYRAARAGTERGTVEWRRSPSIRTIKILWARVTHGWDLLDNGGISEAAMWNGTSPQMWGICL